MLMTRPLALLLLLAVSPPARADWIPPRAATLALPAAAFAPSTTHPLEFTVRANRTPAYLAWSAAAVGPFALQVTPSAGTLVVPAESVRVVTLSLSLPDTALGTAALIVTLTYEIGGGFVAKATGAIQAATGGRPEVWPAPGIWSAAAGTTGSVGFQVHSVQSGGESVVVTTGRDNPDPNNGGGLFPGSAAPAGATLPGFGTIDVGAPTTIPADAYGGNLNAVQLTVSSAAGNSTAIGYALAATPGATPSALAPVGLVPWDLPAAGRDGAADLAARGYRLVPSGTAGVRVLGASGTVGIGAIDLDASGMDDRILGTIRIPSYAAALSIVPGFVAASGDTLDLGLLAAGRSGLMLLDLRNVEDPSFGSWSDFYDVDANGIDDRILRTLPTGGFATDVAWFRAPSGRVVALVADADTGSVPVALTYDPAAVVSGTGAGVVAVDVATALDSLGGVPYAAGTLATSGSALDLELRGGSAPDLAVAAGASGVAVYHLTADGGVPATVTFTPRGTVALSGTWGAPYARDAAWIPGTADSAYLAVAAGGGCVQILRAEPGAAPELVLVQETAAPAIGLATAWTGTTAAAMGAGGVVLLQTPAASELDKIGAGAPAPYAAPVTLARSAAWTAGPLEVAAHQAASSASTALAFVPGSDPLPDLLVSDGPRLLLLRLGSATVTAVESPPAPSGGLLLGPAAPNPFNPETRIPYELSRPARARLEIYDVAGRLVTTLLDRFTPSGLYVARWNGRDARGREVGSGVYVARLTARGETRLRKLVLVR